MAEKKWIYLIVAALTLVSISANARKKSQLWKEVNSKWITKAAWTAIKSAEKKWDLAESPEKAKLRISRIEKGENFLNGEWKVTFVSPSYKKKEIICKMDLIEPLYYIGENAFSFFWVVIRKCRTNEGSSIEIENAIAKVKIKTLISAAHGSKQQE